MQRLFADSDLIDRINAQHDGTEHLTIKDTSLRRWITLLALQTVARFYQRQGRCTQISKHLIVKTGPYVHLTEAATMKFVAENTSLPVPKVYSAFIHKKRAYIVMERMQGDDLPRTWGNLPEESREKVFEQLKRMFQELRALKPAESVGVESCVGGSLHDSRIPSSLPRFGPFKTIQEFHLRLREGLQPSEIKDHKDDQDWRDITSMAARQDGPWPSPVFTHGDLHPFNIRLHGDKVVGIIDWEFSGWYPHYWEYTSAWYGNRLSTNWQGTLDKFLDPFPVELEMEITRQKWWGDF
jgi:aminoglycoside phosphotransferase